jgi:hypothetical protein
MNAMFRILVIVALSTLLVGCETSPKPKPIAHFNHDSQGRYEIQLDASYRTGEHAAGTFPSLISRTVDTTDWIYTSTIEGEIPASQIILTHERGKTEYPWPQQALHGAITFLPGHMHVALQWPYYKQDGTIYRYVQYKLNGDYSLETR